MDTRKLIDYTALICIAVWILLAIMAAFHIGTPKESVPFLLPVSAVVAFFFVVSNSGE